MQIKDLKIEHLMYLLKAFIIGIEVAIASSEDLDERKIIIKQINDFIPKLSH